MWPCLIGGGRGAAAGGVEAKEKGVKNTRQQQLQEEEGSRAGLLWAG